MESLEIKNKIKSSLDMMNDVESAILVTNEGVCIIGDSCSIDTMYGSLGQTLLEEKAITKEDLKTTFEILLSDNITETMIDKIIEKSKEKDEIEEKIDKLTKILEELKELSEGEEND